MITLGLDPSLTGFGWAIHNSTVVGPERVLAKGVISTSSDTNQVLRYRYLRQALIDILKIFPEVQNVGAESPPFGEQYSEGLYALSVYVTEATFLSRRDIVFFDPQTLKMLVRMDSSIRKGSIDKQDVIDAARTDTTIKRWNHNEADAFIIARSAAHFWEFLEGVLVEDDLTPSEAQAFMGPKTKKGRSGGLRSKENNRFFRFSNLAQSDLVTPSHPISRTDPSHASQEKRRAKVNRHGRQA
jgi:Holliday junction resolvasome RuvABC endonuclease subunit